MAFGIYKIMTIFPCARRLNTASINEWCFIIISIKRFALGVAKGIKAKSTYMSDVAVNV